MSFRFETARDEAERLRLAEEERLRAEKEKEAKKLSEHQKRLLRFKSFSFPYLCDAAKWSDLEAASNGQQQQQHQWQEMDEEEEDDCGSFIAAFAQEKLAGDNNNKFWSDFLKAQETNIEEML